MTIQTLAEPGRLDVFVARAADVTRSRAANLIEEGAVLVDGKRPAKAGLSLRGGERIDIALPEAQPAVALAQDIPLRILYQDADVAVVFKPSGMVVHPAAGNPDGTLVNALLQHLDGLSGIGGVLRPGIVHRIDRDTSGILLVAKNDRAHLSLSEQIAAHSVERAYKAIVIGQMKQSEGDVDAPLGRHPTDRKKFAVVKGGKEAFTHYQTLEQLRGAALLECRLKTGRTHQIRVHMASIGHPLLGDPVYGPKKPPYPVEGGQLLHAYRIAFTHPSTGERMRFEAEPEERFLHWLEKLRQK
ncbi:MAG: RluA family pseudouridine synthase [Eubacteriales bacterium]|nr:RluA family pseudouridine synthase [Eubacteriales bacterium]